MARRKVKVSYQPAQRTPSERTIPPSPVVMRTPRGLSPLAAYIEDNRDSEITVAELIEQFQEYDCSHHPSRQSVVCVTMEYKVIRCLDCDRLEKKFKPVAKGDK